MLSFPAERKQGDGKQNAYSDAAAIDCSKLPDRARQEFKADADINILLKRFGVQSGPGGPIYGAWDFDLDLQQALEAIDGVRLAHQQLPDTLATKYPTWESMLQAARNGELRKDLDAMKKSSDEATRQAAIDAALALDIARADAERARRAKAAADRALTEPLTPTTGG